MTEFLIFSSIGLLIILVSLITSRRSAQKSKFPQDRLDPSKLKDPNYIRFMKSNYRHASGNSYEDTFADKGRLGEYLIYLELESLNIVKMIYVNAYIPNRNGRSEVDLIMVSECGIHVFESKNYSGQIYGNESERNWVQVLNGGNNFNFYNPIWQNDNHINALKGVIISNNKNLYRSYIVFSERCVLREISINNKDVTVINRNELKKALLKELNMSEKILSIHQMKYINKRLKPHILASDRIKKNHIRRVKSYVSYMKKLEGEKCPLCNSSLTLRKASKGANRGNQFVGCTSYPRCNYIQNL